MYKNEYVAENFSQRMQWYPLRTEGLGDLEQEDFEVYRFIEFFMCIHLYLLKKTVCVCTAWH